MSVGLLSGVGSYPPAHFESATIVELSNQQIALQWNSQSLTVDNFSGSWLHVIEIDKYYPPLWRGSVDLTGGLTQLTFRWENPPGVMSTPLTPLGSAKVYLTDVAMAPNGGYPVSGTGQVARVIGTYLSKVGGATDGPFTVPAGTMQVVVLYNQNGPPLSMQGNGTKTGAVYPAVPYPQSTLGTVQQTIAAIPFFYGGPDTSLTIFHSDQTNGDTCTVLALFVPLTPTVEAIIANQNGPINTANPLVVSIGALSTPLKTAVINIAGLAAGGSTTIIAGIVGRSITVYGWSIKIVGFAANTFVNGSIVNTPSNAVVHSIMGVTGTIAAQLAIADSYFNLYGKAPSATGDGLAITADAANGTALIARGSLDYTQ